jgi:hypothetical protein
MRISKNYPRKTTGFKTCSRCGELKHVSEFYRAHQNPEGLQYHCKECENHNFKERATLMRYGVTRNKYNDMVKSQDNRCMICGIVGGSEENYGKQLSVDHNHITGQMRGLLCWHCNIALGRFRESIENLENAIKYLQTFNK